MSDIKPIETRYAGCRFRSRLEARWAVFFDHLGIKWQYEPQGYQLSDGSCYLPDFLIHPGTPREFWFEVKGAHPTEEELTKAQLLANGTSKLTFIYFGGVQSPGVGLSSRWNGSDLASFHHSRANRWHRSDDGTWFEYSDGPWPWEVDGEPPTAYRINPATDRFPSGSRRGGHFWWTDCTRCGEVILKLDGQQSFCPEMRDDEEVGQAYPNFRHETARLRDAYAAARSARFEHGELG